MAHIGYAGVDRDVMGIIEGLHTVEGCCLNDGKSSGIRTLKTRVSKDEISRLGSPFRGIL